MSRDAETGLQAVPEPPRAPDASILDWITVGIVAILGGLLAQSAGIAGGLVFGSTIAAGAFAYARGRRWNVAPWARIALMIAVGTTVGVRLSRDVVVGLPRAVGPAVLAALLLVVAGVVVMLLLRRLGRASPGDVMATSPGALEVLTVIAADRRQGPLEVALFHMVRVLLVVLSIPLLLLLER